MKNYVMTKNYKKAFRRLIICFVILAVISAVGIPLSLSQQIRDASVLKQQAALASPDPTNNTATVEASITPVAPPEKPQSLPTTGSSDAPWPALLAVAAGAAWLSRRQTLMSAPQSTTLATT